MSDLISREDAIHILACEMYAEAQSEGYDVESVEDYIPEATAWMSDAPSADRPTGRWMNKDSSVIGITYECSNCGRDCVSAVSYDIKGNEWRYNYCPNCGAKMEGGEEE